MAPIPYRPDSKLAQVTSVCYQLVVVLVNTTEGEMGKIYIKDNQEIT